MCMQVQGCHPEKHLNAGLQHQDTHTLHPLSLFLCVYVCGYISLLPAHTHVCIPQVRTWCRW